MPLFFESEEKIFGDIMLDVINNTNISRTSTGAKARTITEALSKKLGRMGQQFDINMVQAFIDGAEGTFLNLLGDVLGVPRIGEAPAQVAVNDRNVKFYVDVADFGTINSGSNIFIPAGTIISTGSNQTGIIYTVSFDTILSSSDSEGYISVQSTRTGTSANVGKSELSYHNFIDYTDSTNNSLKVTNEIEITRGQDIEADPNFRFRIANQVLAAESANATAVRLAILSTPGVADIVDLPFARGIGTYDVLIQSTTPSVSDSLLAAAQTAANRVTAQGNLGTVRAPIELGISMLGTITLKNSITPKEETDLLEAIVNNVTNYINNLDIAEDFIINQIIEIVLGTSSVIKNLGTTGKPLDNLYLYTPSKLEDNKVRSTLVTDLSSESDERIIVENKFAGSTPILFRTAT